MTPLETQLWDKIQQFQLDGEGIDFTFSDRLARENGWSDVYALRVIEEYKRFLFLCCVSTDGVTPSDPVDQAWHLHLTFTRSYWIDLCRDTMGQEIHHNPTKGGRQEARKYDGYYTSTRDLYMDYFGALPPSDIWQDNQVRFSDIDFQRVNLQKYWLIKKPSSYIKKALVPPVIVLVGLSFIYAESNPPFPISGFFIVMAIVCAIGIVRAIKGKGGNWGAGSDGGCSSGDGGCSNDDGHSGHHSGDSGCSGSGCSSGCSGCSASGCSGCSSGH